MSGSWSDGWSPAQRRLHWASAALVLAAFAVGIVMVRLPLTLLLEKIVAYQAHKSIGLLLLPLVLWRILLRARRGRPAPDPAIPAWQHRAAAAGHAALHVLLIAVPVLGYAAASTAPGQIETVLFLLLPVPHLLPADEALHGLLRPIHRAAAWLLVLLAAGHAGMALLHHRRGRGTRRGMLGRSGGGARRRG